MSRSVLESWAGVSGVAAVICFILMVIYGTIACCSGDDCHAATAKWFAVWFVLGAIIATVSGTISGKMATTETINSQKDKIAALAATISRLRVERRDLNEQYRHHIENRFDYREREVDSDIRTMRRTVDGISRGIDDLLERRQSAD